MRAVLLLALAATVLAAGSGTTLTAVETVSSLSEVDDSHVTYVEAGAAVAVGALDAEVDEVDADDEADADAEDDAADEDATEEEAEDEAEDDALDGATDDAEEDAALLDVFSNVQDRGRGRVRGRGRGRDEEGGSDDNGVYYDAANMPSWLVPPWVSQNSPTGPLIPTYGSGFVTKTFNIQKWKGAVPPQPVFPLDSGYAASAVDSDHFPQSGVFPNDARYHSPALSVTAPIFAEIESHVTARAVEEDANTDADADAEEDAAEAEDEDESAAEEEADAEDAEDVEDDA